MTAPLDHATRKWSVPAGVVGAGIAESDLGTAPVIAEALHHAIDSGLLTYLPDSADSAAREAFAGFAARRYGWDVDPDSVATIPDVLTGLTLALTHLVRPGAVVLPTPAYANFFPTLAGSGREIIEVPSRGREHGFALDLDAIESALARGAAAVVLCHPHNPTGTVADRATLVALAAMAEHHGARVFSDEIHAPVVYDGARHVPFASVSTSAAHVGITATSASKGWNVPGLKAAQLVLTNPTDRGVIAARALAPVHAGSVLGAVAAAHAYSPDGERWLDATVATLQGNRDRLAAALTTLPTRPLSVLPAATYLAWLEIGCTPEPDSCGAARLRRAGLATTPGEACGAGYAGFARFNFALLPDVLDVAIDRLLDALG